MCDCACADDMCDFCKEHPAQCHKNKGATAPSNLFPKCGACAYFVPAYAKTSCIGLCKLRMIAVDMFHSCKDYESK